MKRLTCLLTQNDCYRTGAYMRPAGVMVHSTGADNPTLRRYVQPTEGSQNEEELLALLGVNQNGNHWNRSGVDKCVHGFIGKLADGGVAACQTLPWNMRGWHAGQGTSGRSANDSHISFEICEDGLEDSVYFAEVYRAAVELTAMLCSQYGLDPMEDGVVICHSEGYRRGIASGHADVEHWFPRQGKTMDDFRADVAREMEEEPVTYEQWKEYMAEYRRELRDNDSAPYSEEARRWAVANGVFQGGGALPDGSPNYMWEDLLTREQCATILYRFALREGLV